MIELEGQFRRSARLKPMKYTKFIDSLTAEQTEMFYAVMHELRVDARAIKRACFVRKHSILKEHPYIRSGVCNCARYELLLLYYNGECHFITLFDNSKE